MNTNYILNSWNYSVRIIAIILIKVNKIIQKIIADFYKNPKIILRMDIMEDQMKNRNVYIIGSKGIPAKYGGFETFVDKLTEYNQDPRINYYVACMGNENKKYTYHNACCFQLSIPKIGAAKAIYYDMVSLQYVIRHIKEHSVQGAIIYILACRLGPLILYFKGYFKRLGISVFINPDGHEWKRDKWNWAIKQYWKLSERLMVKSADCIVCDSINIEKYINTKYSIYRPRTTYISYGAELKKSQLTDVSPELLNWYKVNHLSSKEYFLCVGRFVPENNYMTIINEFMKSSSKKRLVIVTDAEGKSYYELIRKKTGFMKDKRILFVGTIYNQELLRKIREHAYGYIHGHEVGGTNPSLLEALGSTDINLLLDVDFNKEVAENGATYWNKEPGSLCNLINSCENWDSERISRIAENARSRIKQHYSWEFITNQYQNLFRA